MKDRANYQILYLYIKSDKNGEDEKKKKKKKEEEQNKLKILKKNEAIIKK